MDSAGKRRADTPGGPDCVVGIDTGGTYTDGVLLDYLSRRVLATSKALTTRADLSQGIAAALRGLAIKEPARIKLVSVSSTLATNSIAEGKGRRVGLLLVGYDRDLIVRYGLEPRFPTPFLAYVRGGHTVQGDEKEPLDRGAIQSWAREIHDQVDAFAISSYFSPLNISHEEEAFHALREVSSLPVVLGHQLSNRLDSIRRATTACLNASLVAIMGEFIDAVRASLKSGGIEAPLMIVKGDGSLMPYETAVERPVETILSGPAASAIGGKFLSGYPDALVVDIGGTTTDIILVEGSQVSMAEQGARVGDAETSVRAAEVRTIGLGGDSRISAALNDQITVGPERVAPLCYLAAAFPRVERELLRLKGKPSQDWRPTDLEYWFLERKIPESGSIIRHERERDLVQLLDQGPLSLGEILEKLDLYHALQLNAGGLIRQGFIGQSTLTPTDLLHGSGQFNAWSTEAAKVAIDVFCTLFARTREALFDEIFDLIAANIAREILIFLGRKRDRQLPETVRDSWGKWFLGQALTGGSPYLNVTITSRYPLIAMGAPAGLLLRGVADHLKVPLFLPPHAPVANAIGAVAGSVMVVREAIVYPRGEERSGFYVQADGERVPFEESERALAYAKEAVARGAREDALEAGAGDPQVLVDVSVEGNYFRIAARAIGNPRLSW